MSTEFSASDKKFLISVGISTEPTLDDTMLALAQRIAKHTAPYQVKVNADATRLAFVRLALERLLAAEASE